MSLDLALTPWLTSGLTCKKVYGNVMPEGTKRPVITLSRITSSVRYSADGAGLWTSDFQFDVWADDYTAAQKLADELQALLLDFRGAIGATNVQSCQVTNRMSTADTVGSTVIHRVVLEATFIHA